MAMTVERTLSIIKPDATRRDLTGAINDRFERKGLRIIAQKRMQLSVVQAERFYEVHGERPFYRSLVDFMTSGPVVIQVLEGQNGEVALLKTADTFMEATDYVFDEVLWQRQPGDLQIIRVDGGRREIVWSHRPGEAAGHEREDMMSVFGYAVGNWQDKHDRSDDDPVAAAG